MATGITYITKCKQCESPAYYEPRQLVMQYLQRAQAPEDDVVKLVEVECTGVASGVKHTHTYIFPLEFRIF